MKQENKSNELNIKKNSLTIILCSNDIENNKIINLLKKNNCVFVPSIPKNINDTVANIVKQNNSDLIKKLRIDSLYDFSFNKLSMGQKQLIQFVNILNSNNDTIIFNNSFSMIDMYKKEIILKYLKKITDKTIIYITCNKEDIIYSQRLILLDEGNIVFNGNINKIIHDEKQFKNCGFELPFMASLSLKLKYYNLVEKPILNMDSLVRELWK